MDRTTAQLMGRLTRDFYNRVGESFSCTRGSAWPGWSRVLDLIPDGARVLDLACGNLRFERELLARCPGAQVWAVDSCDALAQAGDARISYLHRDLAGLLLEDGALGRSLGPSLAVGSCDAAVCFAFMHHLPLFEQRRRLMEALVGAVRPGGVAAVSFWQFEGDERLLAKARRATEQARHLFDLSGFGPHDHLMGWQDVEGAYRFCHHCSDDEIDALVDGLAGSARVVARYAADGATGRLNSYVVLESEG